MKLLIATHNRGKQRELAALLSELGAHLHSPDDLGLDLQVEETGDTYAANALLKARAYAQAAGMPALADDSGLEVDALDGAPGVRSARFAGADADDADRIDRLLQALEGVPDARRTARFRCVIALAWPGGRQELVEGVCEGRITREPRGAGGFGFDPVFYLPEQGCTMAELPADAKNRISHRARAAAAAVARLRALASGEDAPPAQRG